ncbi:hypothetical protein HOD08_01185 [bacterium]|nr:hypothetical protein [bacterium]
MKKNLLIAAAIVLATSCNAGIWGTITGWFGGGSTSEKDIEQDKKIEELEQEIDATEQQIKFLIQQYESLQAEISQKIEKKAAEVIKGEVADIIEKKIEKSTMTKPESVDAPTPTELPPIQQVEPPPPPTIEEEEAEPAEQKIIDDTQAGEEMAVDALSTGITG